MSGAPESLQTILENIIKEHSSNGMELMDSTLNDEIRMLMKAKIANVLLERLKSRIVDKLEMSREIEKEFEAAVLSTWKKPLDLLDLLLNICLEISNDFKLECETSSSKSDFIREALAKQHANACLVFNEILHLLKSGFPSGALLHWKTLHEIVCVSYFISKHGKDMAKRFLDYEAVEAYLQAEAIHEHQKNIDCGSLSQRDFKTLKKDCQAMKKLYGPDFVR